MIEMSIFIILSVVIIFVSRGSLFTPRSHGFYRFFAWELIAVLFVLNANVWFAHPWSGHQIISWLLLMICVILLSLGLVSLVARGKSIKRRESEPQLLPFEKTTVLVTTGVYRYIRHPLYSSLLFLAWGIFFKAPGLINALLAITTTLFLVATAKADEIECLRFLDPLIGII